MNENIETERVLLRKYSDDDKEIVADFFTDTEIGRYMGDGPCDNREDAYTLFNEILKIYDGLYPNRHFEVWAIELEGELIGHIELKQSKNTLNNELEIVYLLDTAYWGQGYMLEIIQSIKIYAASFEKIVIATVKKQNQASIRVLEKSGIKKIQVLENDPNVLKITLK